MKESDKPKIYTRQEAADIVDAFEEVLSKHNICVPSPEDDERESDNMVGLYGSTYYDLLDFVEHTIINLLETYEKCKPEIVTDMFNDFVKEDNNV